MKLSIRYSLLLNNFKPVFEIPEELRKLFVAGYDSAISTRNLPNSTSNALANQKATLQNIKDETLGNARKKYLGLLYEYGVIFSVSISEYLLKSAFSSLISNNLEKIKIDKEFNIKFKDVANTNFCLNKDYWSELIIEDIFSSKNPNEKANFQNIKAIESLLSTYFDVSLFDIKGYKGLSIKAHLYLQLRHILVHNQGIADQRFINNLDAAGILTNPRYEAGKRIRINRARFVECNQVFLEYFKCLDKAIEEKALVVE